MGRNTLVCWAAGYLDGEGHFSVRGNAREIRVDSCDPSLLARLTSIFGGSTTVLKARKRRGKSRKHRRAWRWRICGDRAKEAARALLDAKCGGEGALQIKRVEAEVLFQADVYPAGTALGDAIRERAMRFRHHEHLPK